MTNSSGNYHGVEKMIGKSLPMNIEAERAILASVLLYNPDFSTISDLLRPADFYVPAHQIIYQCLEKLSSDNIKSDIILVQNELIRRGRLEEIGGITFLLSLTEEVPALGLIESYAKLIKEKAVMRELIASAGKIIADCYAPETSPIETILDSAEKSIFQISQKRAEDSYVQLDICLKKTFKHLSAMKSHAGGITGIASGFKQLDSMTAGFQKSDLIIVGARPSMGKTAFAINIALHAALENNAVGIISLEMSLEQLTMRLLSNHSEVDLKKILTASLADTDWKDIIDSAGAISALKLFIDDFPGQTIMEVRAKARKLKSAHNIQMLVIDYLQLIRGGRRYENRNHEIADISQSLKALAKELNIPILLLSQLSRAVDSRQDKRPLLSDLRDSGSIEQDADIIMFLYRSYVYTRDLHEINQSEVIIGKHRNGETGSIPLQFHGKIVRFDNVI